MKDQSQIIAKLVERIEFLEKFVQTQAREIKTQAAQIKTQAAQIKSQALIISSQSSQITELKSRLNKNSSNSSKPPSSDGLSKPPSNKDRSLRLKGKNKSGGQKGHVGSTLMRRANPDQVLLQELNNCPRCSSDLSGVSAHAKHSRQVFDIPPIKLEVTEHQIEVKHCPGCGSCVQSCFPEGVDGPVQYGPALKSFSLYLQHQHFIPEARLQAIFKDLFGIKICPASLAKFGAKLHESLSDFDASVLAKVSSSSVKHLDETGFRVVGRTQWLHVASNEDYTYYHVSPKRKSLLSALKGTVIHDYWKPYFQLEQVTHGLCNAHHLRELNARIEEKEHWASKMKRLLYYGLRLKKASDGKPISSQKLDRYIHLYSKIVDEGMAYHEDKKPLVSRGTRGRKKRRAGHNLLIRLRNNCGDALRFLTDPEVPFTNNQAERDLRMMKCKQKISGGFRSQQGAEQFARIRGFISTSKKQGWNILDSIKKAISGQPPVLT